MYYDVIMTGFGGQGIQMISQLVAVASIKKGLNVSYLPSYGVEKRGGRTNVVVVISDEEIGSPITNTPCSLIAMDATGLQFYQPQVIQEGLLIANADLIPDESITRTDVSLLKIRCNDEALKMGNSKMANMILLGTFVEKVSFLDFADIESVIGEVISSHHRDLIPENLNAVRRGMELAEIAR